MRKFLIWAGASLAALVLVVGFGLVQLQRNGLPPRPAALDEPRVVERAVGMQKAEVGEDLRLGRVTDLRPGGFGDDPCPLLVGEAGAAWLATDGCPPRRVGFDRDATHVDAVDWDGDGRPEFLSRGQWCCAPRIYDDQGEIVWQLDDEKDGANDVALLPAADGRADLVVGFNGGGGVVRVGHDGAKRWRQEDGNVWHVAVLDADGDGTHEIVHSNACGCVVVRDTEGNVISEKKPKEGYLSDFDVVHWRGAPALLTVEDGKLLLLDLAAETRATFVAPLSFDLAEPRGAVLGSPDSPWLVSLLSGANYDRSVLTVHDPAGREVYSEVLEGACDAIAAAGESEFWVGCTDTVFRYGLGERLEHNARTRASSQNAG